MISHRHCWTFLRLLLLLALPSAPALAQKAYLPDGVDNAVSVLDTSTGTVTGSIVLNGGNPPNPSAVAITPDGSAAYVAEAGTNSVVAVTLATGAVSPPIAVGAGPVALAVSPDGHKVYVVNGGGNSVSVIDIATGTVAPPISVGNGAAGIAITPDGSRICVVNSVDSTISVISTASGVVSATIAVQGDPTAIAITPDGSKALVGGDQSWFVSVIDIATGQLATSFPVSDIQDLVLSPDGSKAYVLDGITIQVFDVSSAAAVGQITLPEEIVSLAITPDGKTAYAMSAVQESPPRIVNSVFALDLASGTIAATIPIGGRLSGLAITPDGSRAVVPNASAETLSVIATATQAISATVPLGPVLVGPLGVGFTPDGAKAFVTENQASSVAVIDTASDTVTATVAVGNGPTAVAVTPDGTKAYVTNAGDGTVSVLDTASTAVTATISGIADVTFAPDGRKAYAASAVSGQVAVIDVASNSLSAEISIGQIIVGMAITPDGRTLYVSTFIPSPGKGAPDLEEVFAVDTATDTVSPQVGVNVWGGGLIAVSPDGDYLYVASPSQEFRVEGLRAGQDGGYIQSYGLGGLGFSPDGSKAYIPSDGPSNVVVVVDTATWATSTITVGNWPAALGNFVAPVPPSLAAAVLPGSRGVQTGVEATVFATVLNTGATALDACAIALDATAPAALTMSYQPTDPTTNAPVGTPNTPVAIPGHGSQSFVLAFQSSDALSDPGQPLTITCDGVPPAPIVTGVNTVDLGFSATPTEDIIALAATAPQSGTVSMPVSGSGAFAVATYNAGVTGTLTVSADTGNAILPLTALLCPTDPSSGQCLAPPAVSFQQSFAANATPTFSVFLGATGQIPFAPATSRVFVRFKDAAGITHGSTSVAVEAP
jgi:YVTN family beta-propeller protein